LIRLLRETERANMNRVQKVKAN